MDKLQSKIAEEKKRKKGKKLQMAYARMTERWRNWIRDIHYTFPHWLCRTYKIILLPLYDIRGMISKRNGLRINSKSVRGMINWCPAKFRDTLYVSQQYNNVMVVIVSEAYRLVVPAVASTQNLKVAKFLNAETSRARNILLCWLTESVNLPQRL